MKFIEKSWMLYLVPKCVRLLPASALSSLPGTVEEVSSMDNI